MKILAIHQNFPGQYKHLLFHLGASGKHEIIGIGQHQRVDIPGVKTILYKAARAVKPDVHHYLKTTESAVLNAQGIVRTCMELRSKGFVPDVILGHAGWGETLYLKDVYPNVPVIGYFEFFYRSTGADVGFDPEYPATFDDTLRIRTWNMPHLLALDSADYGQTPTAWQRNQIPQRYHDLINVIHEGIDTTFIKPDANAKLEIAEKGLVLDRSSQVITYVARNLEPYRGFHVFMRALPRILKQHPKAHVVIVGGDEVSYGRRLPGNETYRQKLLAEVGSGIDAARVHFLGRVPYATFLKVLQISSAHVYLTYPFVLSWSMLEAMAAGCLVIGSRTPPVMEAINDREHGLLVDFFSIEAIAGAVAEALDQPEKMQVLRQNARERIVKQYDLHSVCLPQQLALLERACRR
ncbi:glycosyltransferase family 4 protein [Janthinobacterium sp. 17J80-10]|uniref:glycosyltransferase family 4 protein n=1 Tax=Janthinobacterium sp. 17J80-10 TaxID=2497863 RepID=UPI0010054628|nr:glycosyltransferase family 4 protein [Janthinobacterium sp. 17J80-10]QAU35554.1 glycosyltransferase [Janthinobacterium sp. 17J80-10]